MPFSLTPRWCGPAQDPRLVDGIPVGLRIEAISTEKEKAAQLEQDAAAKTKILVKELVAHKVPLRDIGEMLELSFQRVHQLAA